MLKEQKGITLVALVITIIVLLILAAVSIAMLTGENGILNKATTAKDETIKAEAVERINMELNALYAEVLASPTKDVFNDGAGSEIEKANNNVKEKNCSITLDSTKKIVTGASTITGVTSGNVTITEKGKATITAATYTK